MRLHAGVSKAMCDAGGPGSAMLRSRLPYSSASHVPACCIHLYLSRAAHYPELHAKAAEAGEAPPEVWGTNV